MENGGSTTPCKYRRQSSVDSGGSHGSLQKGGSYRGQTQAWWSVDEHMKPRGVMLSSHQKMGMSLAARIFNQQGAEDSWDLSDSLADLYLEHDIISKKSWSSMTTFKPPSNLDDIDRDKWISADTSHGFIRVYPPDSTSVSEVGARVIPCSLAMEAHSICQAIGVAPNSLHVQFGGDIIRRLDPYEHPLVLQNEYLSKIGFHDFLRIQKEGLSVDLGYLIRFFSGKPFFDNTFSRNHLSAYLDIRLSGVLSRWCKRLCTLTGTQLKIYKDKSENGTAQVIQLSNGSVEECKTKTHPHYIKLTTQSSGPEKCIYLSFETFTDYSKWLKKCRKAVAKLPSNADLSNCNLEFLPETLFINGQLSMLNLRHNALRHRPTQEDIYTIGWLEDLPRFQCLRSLNLADNNLEVFPASLCEMSGLVELNLACNKIETVPEAIGDLVNLQALHLHNNHLSTIPNEILQLKKLVILVLAFNKFHQIPGSVAQLTDVRSSECDTIIMAGNLIDSISSDVITKLRHVKKVDLRMNNLTLPVTETQHMSAMEQLTHLDLRMNNIKELDLRSLKSLEYLNVERNDIHSLQLNGSQMKTIFAAHNGVQQFLVNPKPEWLEIIDLSYNKLEKLPEWLSDCSFLKRLNVSNNRLQRLPYRLFSDAQRLKQLIADHNEIRELPSDISNSVVEEINLHHNSIDELPEDFLSKLNKLKILNLSSNELTFLPPLNEIEDLNKVHELYLTQNGLQDDCIEVIAGYHRLKILHLAYNELTCIDERLAQSLELLQELNISGNRIKTLPKNLVNMPELRLLRAHSNLLKTLPDLAESSSLKVLDVACNKLLSISASELASSSQLHSLDMQMTQFSIDKTQMEIVKKSKQIKSVDSSGENKELSSLSGTLGSSQSLYKIPKICQLGFAETSGTRNKLCVTVLHQLSYKDQDEALFAMFDGGRNCEVPKILKKIFPTILAEEIESSDKPNVYLKYAFLQAHKALKNSGQYLGSSALVCHIRRNEENSKRFYLNIANCGDTVALLCRAGEPLVLSQQHTVVEDREEASRIFRTDGIITEENRVNGTSITTRALGNCYLYPHLIPEPHVLKKTLRPEDQFLVIANSSLWRFLSYKEAIEEIQYIANPVVAAKRLQDLAQGYGCKENVSVLVIQFNCNFLSSAQSVGNLSTTSEGVVFHTLQSLKDKDTGLRLRKRPIPAPRASTGRATDSMYSLADNLTDEWAGSESSHSHSSSIDNTAQYIEGRLPTPHLDRRTHLPLPTPRQSPFHSAETFTASQQGMAAGVPGAHGSPGAPGGYADSTSTLTDTQEEEESFDHQMFKTPLYSSDTRLLEFADSTSTVDTVGVDGHPPLTKNSLYQSDTRLLNPSEIEVKSTNYFTRAPLSVSSLGESDYGDYLNLPFSDSSHLHSSQSTVTSSRRPYSRHAHSRIHDHVQSPDGSYFSIDSDEGSDFNLYENIADLKLISEFYDSTPTNSAGDLTYQMTRDKHSYGNSTNQISSNKQSDGGLVSPPSSSKHSCNMPTNHTPQNKHIPTNQTTCNKVQLNTVNLFYQGPSDQPTVSAQSSDRSIHSSLANQRPDISVVSVQQNVAKTIERFELTSSASSRVPQPIRVRHHDVTRFEPAPNRISKSIAAPANNVHHFSNGSSAYGSGSLAASQDSDIDIYL